MQPEDRELLKRSVQVSEENNDLLRSLLRSARITRVMTFIYWLFIIGSAVGAYYVFQPYMDSLFKAYKNIGPALDNVKNSVGN